MPELPEVETIARRLQPALVGRAVQSVDVLWARTVDRPAPDEFRQGLTGVRFTAVHRRGKYIIFDLDSADTLLAHLRMSGKFTLRSGADGPGDDPHTRLRIALDDGTWVVFIDPRKFGRFYLVSAIDEVLRHLGPEPLSPEFSPEWLYSHIAGRRAEIKRLLLDQRFVAGIGNIYVSEGLWRAGIHPARAAGSLSAEECEALHRAIVEVLQESIAEGGTSLEDRQYAYPDGGLGGYQLHLSVYDRAEKACPRCGYAIIRIVQGQRSTYVCPICQSWNSSEMEG
jgi:formamidopyrimidine-DNA glycosylase